MFEVCFSKDTDDTPIYSSVLFRIR